MAQLIALIQAAIVFGTVILFGATGEILTEKSGNLNLGVPGIMYLGGVFGLIGAFWYESAVAEPNALLCILIAAVFAFGAAVLGGLIYSLLTITLRAHRPHRWSTFKLRQNCHFVFNLCRGVRWNACHGKEKTKNPRVFSRGGRKCALQRDRAKRHGCLVFLSCTLTSIYHL